MDSIRTTLTHHIYNSSGASAELRLVPSVNHFKLLDGILGESLENTSMEIVVVVESINQIGSVAGPFAHDRAVGVSIRQISARLRVHHDAWSKQDQVEIVAPIQGHRINCTAIYYLF